MRAYMYSVALLLACVATTVLTETNAENADSQATIRALLNDLNAVKSTNKRQQETIEGQQETIEAQGAKLEAHGQGIKALSTATRRLMVQDIEGTRACVSATKGGKCVKAAAAAASEPESLVASLGEGTGGATGVTIGETSAGLKQICIVAKSSKIATMKKMAERVLKRGGKKARKGASDPGAPARCDVVHDGFTKGNKKCPIGKYQKIRWPNSAFCPDGIGYQGVYVDLGAYGSEGGSCTGWTGSAASVGTIFCEKHICVDPKTGLSSAKYRQPRAKSGANKYRFLCKKPGITPFKGVCDKTDKKGFCDKSGAPTVCLKMQALHTNMMSRSAGILIMKRSSCGGPTGKCSTFKSGLCIDVRKNVWASSLNTDMMRGMLTWRVKRFARAARWVLKKYKNNLPKKHRCSDHRHKFMVKSRGKWKWHHNKQMNMDATLSRMTILNF